MTAPPKRMDLHFWRRRFFSSCRSFSPGTSVIGVHQYVHEDGQTIYFIDSPDFDDTHRTDTEILRELAHFLGVTYANGVKLAGIIYLHRITDNRMQGSTMKNLSLFQKLCGKQSLSNVVLATTMWDNLKTAEQKQKAEAAEKELEKREHWGSMIAEGSKVFRQDNGRSSALKIVDYILGLQKRRIVMQVQKRIIDEKKELKETSVGQEFDREIIKLQKRHQMELEEVQKSLKVSQEQHKQELAAELKRNEEEKKQYLRRLERNRKQLEQKFEKVQKEMDWQYREEIMKSQAQTKKLEGKLVKLGEENRVQVHYYQTDSYIKSSKETP